MLIVSISYSSSLWNAIIILLQLNNNFKTISRNIKDMDSSFSPSSPFKKWFISLKYILEASSTTALNTRTTQINLSTYLIVSLKFWEVSSGWQQIALQGVRFPQAACELLQQAHWWQLHGFYLLPNYELHSFILFFAERTKPATWDFHNVALNCCVHVKNLLAL